MHNGNFPHFLSLGIVAAGPFSSHTGETDLCTVFLGVAVSAEPPHSLALASLWPTSGICIAISQKAAYGHTSEKINTNTSPTFGAQVKSLQAPACLHIPSHLVLVLHLVLLRHIWKTECWWPTSGRVCVRETHLVLSPYHLPSSRSL